MDPVAVEEFLSRPSPTLLESVRALEGPVLVLGAGGKMGLHLSAMLARARTQLGKEPEVVAVSRFRSVHSEEEFSRFGVRTLACDLEQGEELARLPEAPCVVYMAGAKFGTADAPDMLRRINVDLPQRVLARFPRARFIAFSTGCVYSMVAPGSGGSRETDPTDPPGDYARSCLGREEAFAEASRERGTPSCLIRLNYATEFRYGVLVDIARQVNEGRPIDLRTGYVNVIWQRDAVDQILRTLPLAESPPRVLNITGREILRVRDIAVRLGELLQREPVFHGREEPTAWLNNASLSHQLLGLPETSLGSMLTWTAEWVRRGASTFGKPTGFEKRDGRF